MKKVLLIIASFFMCASIFAGTACAYWIWTPETKKFVNPKLAPKDSPKEQFDWAMSFYNAKDYKRAAPEFEKVTKYYEYSEYASKAQYYVGLSYENMGKLYTAFENYQKAIDNFPHIENLDEIIAREFNIGKIYASKDNPKVMGADIMAPLDRAIDIFKKVVENAPYGKLADEAQVNLAEALKRSERFDEAVGAYQKIIDDYPNSKFSETARYEVADCAYRASLKPAYDSTGTDKAIKAFQEFTQVSRDTAMSRNADKTVQRLRDNMAQKSVMTAEFYEGQGKYRSAIIYYQDVINNYPDSSFVNSAKAKIESLKVKLAQPKAIVMDMFKKKDRVKTVKSEEGVSEAAPAKKKEGWSFFGLGKAKPKEITEEPKEGISEAAPPQKKGWSFFGLGKARPKEEAAEAPKAKKWTPLSFDSSTPRLRSGLMVSTVEPQGQSRASDTSTGSVSARRGIEKPAKPETAVIAAEEKPQTQAAEEKKEEAPPEAQPQTAAVEEAVKEAPQNIKEAPEKKGWTWAPLNFEKPAKPKEAVAEAQAPEQKKKEGWSFFGLGKAKPKEIVEEPKEGISEAAPPQKKGWSFFGLGKARPKEEAAEAPKAKKWTPLSFDSSTPRLRSGSMVSTVEPQGQSRASDTSTGSVSARRGIEKPAKPKEELSESNQAAAHKKNGWTPLNFTNGGKFKWQGLR